MFSDGVVCYRFHAFDPDLELNLDCLIHLKFAPSDLNSACGLSAMSSTIILGEFKAVDVVDQATSWFDSQFGVQIDHDSILDFLTIIEKYTSTSFVAVIFDIVAKLDDGDNNV